MPEASQTTKEKQTYGQKIQEIHPEEIHAETFQSPPLNQEEEVTAGHGLS